MNERLLKPVVLYSSGVYLEVIPAGSDLSASSDLHFPIDTTRQPFFHFSVGQMAGLTPDEADFQQLTELTIDQFPETPDGMIDVRVMIAIYDQKELYVGVELCLPDGGEALLAMDPPLGPFAVD
jgi:hypothetical protein